MVQTPAGAYSQPYSSPLPPSPYAHQLPLGSAQMGFQMAPAGTQQPMFLAPHSQQVICQIIERATHFLYLDLDGLYACNACIEAVYWHPGQVLSVAVTTL